jgi:hypothetical protein
MGVIESLHGRICGGSTLHFVSTDWSGLERIGADWSGLERIGADSEVGERQLGMEPGNFSPTTTGKGIMYQQTSIKVYLLTLLIEKTKLRV